MRRHKENGMTAASLHPASGLIQLQGIWLRTRLRDAGDSGGARVSPTRRGTLGRYQMDWGKQEKAEGGNPHTALTWPSSPCLSPQGAPGCSRSSAVPHGAKSLIHLHFWGGSPGRGGVTSWEGYSCSSEQLRPWVWGRRLRSGLRAGHGHWQGLPGSSLCVALEEIANVGMVSKPTNRM